MKKVVLLVIMTALIASIGVFASGEQESTSSGTQKAVISEGPLAGKAVDENGKPYILGYVLNETGSGWMSANMNYVKSLWERAGGKFYSFVSDYDMYKEISMMDDLMQMDPDAILLHPSDSYAIAPAVKKAKAAGYPVFAIDIGVMGEKVNSFVSTDQGDMGYACGKYVLDNSSASKPAKILEIAGGLEQVAAQLRQKGFYEAVETSDYAEVVQTIDTGWSSDVAFDGIQDAFERNPDINVIFSHSDFMMQGILEGLRVKGKLVPRGEEGHIMVVSIDADPLGLQGIREGHIDMCAENNPLTPSAVVINVILAELYRVDYKDEYVIEVPVVTAENVDSDARWANLPSGKYDEWSVADQDLFPTPVR